MARKCQAAREDRREKLAARYKERRAALKKKIADPDTDFDERREAMFALQRLPRDSSPCRYTSRCQATGVSRAVYRKFRLNRIAFREMALEGQLPGVTKASW